MEINKITKELAKLIAQEANRCCLRSDGYEEDIAKFAEEKILAAFIGLEQPTVNDELIKEIDLELEGKYLLRASTTEVLKQCKAALSQVKPINNENLEKLIKRLEGFKMLNAYGYFEKLGKEGFFGFENADYKTLDNFRTIFAEYSILPEVLNTLKELSQVKLSVQPDFMHNKTWGIQNGCPHCIAAESVAIDKQSKDYNPTEPLENLIKDC